MWVNIPRVMDWAPEYLLLDRVFEELEERIAGLKTFKRNILAKPTSKYPIGRQFSSIDYHCRTHRFWRDLDR